MTVAALLAELSRRDIQIWSEGGQLRCNAPAGELVPELRAELRQRKGDILRFLQSAGALAQQQRAIVPLQPHGDRVPVFAVAGHNGDVFCYRALAQHLGSEQPFFGLQPPGLDGDREPITSVVDLAAHFAGQIRAFRPEGPYVIAGFCAGGTIAVEVARQLLEQGAEISFVAQFACPFPGWYRSLPQRQYRLVRRVKSLGRHFRALLSLPNGGHRQYIIEKLRQHKADRDARTPDHSDPVMVLRHRLENVTLEAVRRNEPEYFAGRVCMFLPTRGWLGKWIRRWQPLTGHIEEYYGPDGCDGDRILLEPYVSEIAELFRRACEKPRRRPS